MRNVWQQRRVVWHKNKIKTVFVPGQLTSSSAHASLSQGLCKLFWTVRLNPMSMKDKIDSSGVFPWSFPIQHPLYIMCLVSRFTENFQRSKGSWKSRNQKEQVTVSEESSSHSSPLATSHPDARDACQILNWKVIQIAKCSRENRNIHRTVSVSVVRKTSEFFTDHPTLPVVGNIHEVPGGAVPWRTNSK